MRRRDFISSIGGAAAAASPLAAYAQDAAKPVVGYLSSVSRDPLAVASFLRGLSDQGYIEGRNVLVEYRFADGNYAHLPSLARELASLPVAVIAAVSSSPAALAAKGATSNIPIVFHMGVDPAEIDLIANFNRPEGNITGIFSLGWLTAKRMGLLHELLPQSLSIGELVNPTNRTADQEIKGAREAAQALSRELIVVRAATPSEIDAAFETLVRERVGGLVVWNEAYFMQRRNQIVALAQHHGIPTIYPYRSFIDIGGLMSYGTDFADLGRHVGSYVGRILKGTKPSELPVLQPTKFELIINLGTAKSLGLTLPPGVLAVADEVIQ